MAGRPLRRARLEAETRANGKTLPARRDHRAEMTAKLIAQLQAGTAPWQKTWIAGSGGRPYNPLSADVHTASGQRGYSGINRVVLMVEGAAYGDDRWCTRKQAEEKGYTLRRGMTGTTIEVWKPYVPKAAEGDDRHRDKADDRSRMGVRFYSVYNAGQFSDYPPVERVEHTWTPIERAEQLLTGSGAKIVHSASEETPHYAPGRGHIVLPSKERFISPEAYYDTATHELVHWTGHESRLNRFEPDTQFGTSSYAREELVAEIGSMFLSADTGISHNVGQHAAYVNSWIRLLQDDKNAVARAAGAASKAVDHLLSLGREKSTTKMLLTVQHPSAVVTARSLPTSSTSNDEQHRYDPLDGAYLVEITPGRRVETWGDEHPALALRNRNNGGCSLRFDMRDSAWKALSDAVGGKGRVESRMDGFVRDANEIERRAEMRVVVGRTTTGRILISMQPLLEPEKAIQVRLTREAADMFARAMETNNHRQRKALVFEALHHEMETNYECIR